MDTSRDRSRQRPLGRPGFRSGLFAASRYSRLTRCLFLSARANLFRVILIQIFLCREWLLHRVRLLFIGDVVDPIQGSEIQGDVHVAGEKEAESRKIE